LRKYKRDFSTFYEQETKIRWRWIGLELIQVIAKKIVLIYVSIIDYISHLMNDFLREY